MKLPRRRFAAISLNRADSHKTAFRRCRTGLLAYRGILFFLLAMALVFSGCASRGAATAEEYFSLGMAYFDLGQTATDGSVRLRYFGEAEKWLNMAKRMDKTKSASEYNLGRIAFEAGRYGDAVKYFERILERDSENILALKAVSYTLIRQGEIERAEAHYQKLLSLVPDSADEGYNYALVLYTMEKYADAERVLSGYRFALLNNSDTLLLYARAQKAQNKAEAANSYAQWLAGNKNFKVRIEYAQILEAGEFYARALEEYRLALAEIEADATASADKPPVRFEIGRLLLIADSESAEGITEITAAKDEGFSDIAAVEKLLEDKRISADNVQSLNTLIGDMRRAQEETSAAASLEDSGDTAASDGVPQAALEEDVEGSAESAGE